MWYVRLVFIVAVFFGITKTQTSAAQMNAHDFSFTSNVGTPLPLSAYKGKTLLIVNTASQCSFTKQYGPLQQLYERYKDEGLVVIAVPSNDFGGQEPGSNEEISKFVKDKFSVGFPITSKTKVRGDDASDFYKWAAKQTGFIGKPRWNFHKYLIGPSGNLITWFTPMTKPGSKKLSSAIEQTLRGK